MPKKNLAESPFVRRFFLIFAAENVERFVLIATTRKNAKPMRFPSPFSQQLPTQIYLLTI